MLGTGGEGGTRERRDGEQQGEERAKALGHAFTSRRAAAPPHYTKRRWRGEAGVAGRARHLHHGRMSPESVSPPPEPDAGPAESLEGALLVAMPAMGDPRFHQTVIYVCSHGADGAMGLIINKPARELSFSDLLEQVGVEPGAGAEGFEVHFGGPVEVGRGFVLHSDDWEAPGATKPLPDGLALTATVEILRAISADRGPREAVLTLGYAGWGAGQLEAEIRESGWLICPADRALVFSEADETKWATAMRRIGVEPGLLSARGGSA